MLASPVCYREVDDKTLLMKISLEIDKDMLLSYSAIQYKYAVVHSNGKYMSWEFVPRQVIFGDVANRFLIVPRDQIPAITGMFL